MSENPSVDSTLEQLKETYARLAFVHQVLTQSTRYQAEEFKIADEAIRMITDMANKLSDDIKAQLPKETDSNEQA